MLESNKLPPSDFLTSACARSLHEWSATHADELIAVYLFGSQAEGRAHRESDVDLAVLMPGPERMSPGQRFEARLRLIGQLEAMLGTRRLDLVVLNDLPPLFARHIVTTGKRLFVGDEETDRQFFRDVLLRAADLQPFLKRAARSKLEALAT